MMNKSLSLLTKALPIATSLLLMSGCVVHISTGSANIEQQQQRTLSATQLQQLDIEAEAGSLKVIGSNTATEITVDATIYTANVDDPYILTLEQDGDKAVLTAKSHKASGMIVYQGNSPSIDLVVTVPNSFNLDIDDSSGDINIKGVLGDMDIDDGSGSIDIDQGHDLEIDDGSGDINLQNITGSIEISDGSGSLAITNTKGNLTIEDGSGDIRLSKINGRVDIDDNSGSINAIDLGNALTIEDGSGDIYAEHINGLVTIEDGSGSIRVNHAKGLTIIDDGSGDLSIDNINGPVKLN
ncbi:DUF4097 family beta strand repeat protein [Pseudoalteromonas sp. H105]|uniref:DUF4097 family beta strand repeat protein n=1 Tax=Pseudoalteromonas sp. H105 TaxID=1348393 RepID=UPI000731F132|nr:DUF4097 family beta strand repeat protein [Pseudoalteromonas sp. H105]KTF13669.1 hypothetical protein ATS75_13940 [Pseudoalteromonas sp. H105]